MRRRGGGCERRAREIAREGEHSPPLNGERLVIPVLLGAQHVDVGVDPGLRHGADRSGVPVLRLPPPPAARRG
jgi:hypothetical protein